ncbi:MAG: cysteine--tRNA ligase [Crenarchaeota archaeon]|nr:cysteine--tRNA ligase [Thermoproteota archaeon]MCR8454301.1 cysteine--tRNA ligase [Thermoproteota archaeon]MCR8455069.1 cysteine--tRNA ligase [Thermoproteota archaeon]MCR8463362.1 cysteine--tRNA ligase [Thermoproteota archaeon]MCR8470809.1 cysteine--tRNA ligase [Thermoproteota archaeon]
MSLKVRLYDTLSGKYVTLDSDTVRAYFCGPTVYDHPHLGHARAYVVFDVLVRLLAYLGYKVIYARNVTDIDDKIINKAKEENVSPFEVADKYYREFYDYTKALKILAPNIEPRATAHIPEIIEFIKKLIEKGYAYDAQDGVYFRVRRFKDYGKLSKRNIDEMRAGARVEPSEFKEDPLDFALWKKAKPNEPSWPSPWGPGRPGWHIECSAMALKHLGETIEIHGGGEDLIFPHHENEIAQSEALNEKPLAKIWFHVGLLIFRGEKMAKSLKNFVTIKEALEKFDNETIRLFLLNANYRKQLEFSWEKMEEAEDILDELYRAIFLAEYKAEHAKEQQSGNNVDDFAKQMKQQFLEALCDNLNFVEAIKILREIAKYLIQKTDALSKNELLTLTKLLRELGGILGILQQSLDERINEKNIRKKPINKIVPPGYITKSSELTEKLIRLIIEIRKELRKRKIYDLSDTIREELKRLGIMLEDLGLESKFFFSEY